MTLEAQESIALYILLGGNDVKGCADVARKVSESTGIELFRLASWLETYLPVGFGHSVFRFASQPTSGKHSKKANRASQDHRDRSSYESNVYNRYIEYFSNKKLPPQKSRSRGQSKAKTDKPAKAVPFSERKQIVVAALFLIWYLLLAWLVPTLLDQVMAPSAVLSKSIEGIGIFVVDANRSRHWVHLLVYAFLLLVPCALLAWNRRFSFRAENPYLLMLLAMPLLVSIQGLIIGTRNYNLHVEAKVLNGTSTGLLGKRLSIKLDEVDFNKSKNRPLAGLEFVSFANERMLMPASLFHGQDRERVLDRVKDMSAAMPVVPTAHESVSSNTGLHEAEMKKKTSNWAWIWGVLAFPIIGSITMIIASVLNKHHQGQISLTRFTRNASLALLIAAYGTLISQIVVAVVLILSRHNTGPLYWIMWTLALLFNITIIRKMSQIALRSQEKLELETMRRRMWM
jgi:hypothetical protein